MSDDPFRVLMIDVCCVVRFTRKFDLTRYFLGFYQEQSIRTGNEISLSTVSGSVDYPSFPELNSRGEQVMNGLGRPLDGLYYGF